MKFEGSVTGEENLMVDIPACETEPNTKHFRRA